MAKLGWRPIDNEVLEVFREFENYWVAKSGDDDYVQSIEEYKRYSSVVGRRQLPFWQETLSFYEIADGGEGGIRFLMAILKNHRVETVIMRYEGWTQTIFSSDETGEGKIVTGD